MKRSTYLKGKKKWLAGVLLAAALISGCGAGEAEDASPVSSVISQTASEESVLEESTPETSSSELVSSVESTAAEAAPDIVRIGSLKGPTSMGLVFLMEESDTGKTNTSYEFSMAAAADELTAQLVKGDLDIALIPANVASILYQKTEGGICTIDINTLGVLYVVTGDESITSMDALAGKTIYLTGKGTTPDYVLQYLLSANQIENTTLEYKSEATEVAAVLASDPSAIGVLPQPFATAACIQNESLSQVLSLTDVWNETTTEGSQLVTGATVVRKEFLEQYPEAVEEFLEDHRASVESINTDPEKGAELVAALGIIEKAPVAQKAIPYCNIVCVTGEDMSDAMQGYLQVLYDQDPSSVGGSLPEEDFYFTAGE